VQVKRYKPSKVAADKHSFSEIVTQICQCIETPVPYTDGNTYLPSLVYFVTPYAVDTHTLNTRFSKVAALKQSRVKLLDGPKLASLLEERVPDVFSRLLGGVHQIGKVIGPHLSNSILMSALGFQTDRHIKDFYTDIDIAVGYIQAKYLLASQFTPITKRFEADAERWEQLTRVLDIISELLGVSVVKQSRQHIEGRIRSAQQQWERWKDRQRTLNNAAEDLSYRLAEYKAKCLDKLKHTVRQSAENTKAVVEHIARIFERIDGAGDSVVSCDDTTICISNDLNKQIARYRGMRLSYAAAARKATSHQAKQPSLEVSISASGHELAKQLLAVRKRIQSEATRLSERTPTSKELKTFLEYCQRMFLQTAFIFSDDIISAAVGFHASDDLPEYTRLSMPVNVVFDTGLNVCVLGEAGAGKTTALQMYAHRHYESAELARLVIFAPLVAVVRALENKSGQTKSIGDKRLDVGLVEFLRSLGTAYSLEDFQSSASKGGVLLLDSIDEAYTAAPWIIKSLVELSHAYPKLQLITSSRVSGEYVREIPFVSVRLMPFTDSQQKQFISS
jgi:hypothetical protein